ncbi:30S ribosomal protein S17 [Candidatus Bathyarchaeota archaeon]|nr:MAG: 30S ribosomal protein S17 [Candidatus Bathyarchaeota archaeon]
MSTFSFRRPSRTCDDKKCPFHGTLKVRGRTLEGVVVSDKMERTVIVRRDYLKYVPKFKRYERRRSRIPAHNPPCIDAREGDIVRIAECRPISKTVSFVVVEVLERAKRVGGEG